MLWFIQNKARRRAELLSAYIDGRLSHRERAEVERRLSSSPAWRAELESLQATVALVRQAPRIQSSRSFALNANMVRDRAPRQSTRPPIRPIMSVVTATAAVFLAFSVAGGMTHLFSAPTSGPKMFSANETLTNPSTQDALAGTAASQSQYATGPAGPAGSPGATGPEKDQRAAASPTPMPPSMATASPGLAATFAATPSPAPMPTPTSEAASPAAPPRSQAIASGGEGIGTPTPTASPAPQPAPTQAPGAKAAESNITASTPGPTNAPEATASPSADVAEPTTTGFIAYDSRGAETRVDRVPWRTLEIVFGALTGVLGAFTLWLFRSAGTRS